MIRFQVIGKVGFQPELKTSQGGRSYCSLLVGDSKKDKQGNWINNNINLLAYEKTAEYVSKYVNKDDQVFCEGEIKCNYNKEKKETTYMYFINNIKNLGARAKRETTEATAAPAASQGGLGDTIDKLQEAFPGSQFAPDNIPF